MRKLTPVGWFWVVIIVAWAVAIWFFPKTAAWFWIVSLAAALVASYYFTRREQP